MPASPGYTTNVLTGWTGIGGTGVLTGDFGAQSLAADPTLYPGGIPNGGQYAYINAGSIYQDVSATLQAGVTYSLTAYVGNRTDFAAASYLDLGSISLETSGGSLLAGTGLVSAHAGTFVPETVNFTPDATDPDLGQTLRIVLSNGPGSGNGQANFDDVSLTATSSAAPAVPEPSPVALLGLALPALGLMARRRAL